MKHILILAALFAAAACGQKKAESKVLILYYSQTGTTKAVAEALGISSPDWLVAPLGLVKCVFFAFLCIGTAWALGKVNIKLKI